MKAQTCSFQFTMIEEDTVGLSKLIKSCCRDQQAGIDNIDGKFLRVSYISRPLYATSSCLSNFPQAWKEAKLYRYQKIKGKLLHCQTAEQLVCYLHFVVIEMAIFNQIQHYSSENNLLTELQNAYRKGYSTCRLNLIMACSFKLVTEL